MASSLTKTEPVSSIGESSTAKLVLENVQKTYGKRTVVKGVSLSVSQGEIVGLLGPNGAGKTTTFYMATGLIRPDIGKVMLSDQDITTMPMYQRARLGIGYLAQEASIFRNLSVQDNLRLVMEQTGVPFHQREERLHHLLKEFRLEKVRNSLGIQVSGGERRRTELARALAAGEQGPDFLFLDEPFAGVDPIAVSEIQTIVAQLRDRNMGVLITDHNVRETLQIIDRAYIMSEGQILAAGSASDLSENPLVRQYYLGESFRL
ncbi:MAG: LPS export ABC transporter ATP-binding protein [Phormidesmis sp. RL_2_1]|nr:LPS export ABC transporter ATP-binding protein [Phormidesmis sp. RL_2_1]